MKLFQKILIANRGEIAMRIIRSIRSLGLEAIAVYADDDKDAAHVAAADRAFSLGEGALSETYLNIDKLIRIGKEAGCDAVHPGYGFLSERASFAKAVEEAGMAFIGPDAKAISLMGDKVQARTFVQAQNVPVIEGKTGNKEELLEAAESLSFPLLIKAAAGGGGKGMRIVKKKEDLTEALEATEREATTYFGDGTVYAERYLTEPRHIEVQVFGDKHGNAIHLFERECSLQRRYQKIIEEAPSPSVSEELRERITNAAVTITKAIGYSNAGTIEFLVEGEKDFFFLEMNTRIQVEHPVTEMITGVDLVREQILVAAGNPLGIAQAELKINGHAIESRVYAEDPTREFLPSPGQMSFCHLPEGKNIRVESGISHSLEVSADYDPMIAKVVVWAQDRSLAMEKMDNTLRKTIIHGIESNVPFLLSLLNTKAYKENAISTKFCDDNLQDLLPEKPQGGRVPLLAYLLWWLHSRKHKGFLQAENVWKQIGYWRNSTNLRFNLDGQDFQIGIIGHNRDSIDLTIDEQTVTASIAELSSNSIRFFVDGYFHHAWVSEDGKGNAWITLEGVRHHLTREDVLVEEDEYSGSGAGFSGDPGEIVSPMPGKVVKLMVEEGQEVEAGQLIVIVEAMKMENALQATVDGIVEKVNVKAGDKVDTSVTLVNIAVSE